MPFRPPQPTDRFNGFSSAARRAFLVPVLKHFVYLMLYYVCFVLVESWLEFSACMPLKSNMSSAELSRLLKDYLEARFGLTLDYFVVEGSMAPDAQGNMGVTGSYRKIAGDKNVFFTVTINLASRKIQNLQEY